MIAAGVGIWCKAYLIGQKVEQAEFVQADVVMKDHKVSVQGVLRIRQKVWQMWRFRSRMEL